MLEINKTFDIGEDGNNIMEWLGESLKYFTDEDKYGATWTLDKTVKITIES